MIKTEYTITLTFKVSFPFNSLNTIQNVLSTPSGKVDPQLNMMLQCRIQVILQFSVNKVSLRPQHN